jgi:hypothetical protein
MFLAYPFATNVWRIVFFAYNILPPTKCKNMFENWLNSIDKITKATIHIGFLALYWSIWVETMCFITNLEFLFFAGYSHGYALDPAIVLTSPRGPAYTYGYWKKPYVDGR